MTKCPFYRTEMVTARAHAAHSGRREPAPQRRLAGWCAHPASPVTRVQAVTVQNGATLLTCGGELARCLIPEKLVAGTV